MRLADLVTGAPVITPKAPPVDPSAVTPKLIGFVVIALLVLATWLLLRSFTSRLRKIRVPEDDVVVQETVVEKKEPGPPA